MQFCPQCGSPVEDEKKFCTNCGASLTPDMPGTPDAVSPAPVSLSRNPIVIIGLIVAAGLILLVPVAIFIGYPMLTGSGVLAGSGSTTSAVTPVPTTPGSYVIIETLATTAIPATLPAVITTTLVPTSTPVRTSTVPKPVICASDLLKCNNTCVDILKDSRNCGYCGTECASGQFCLNGQCTKSCSTGQTSCPDGCFNLDNDKDHCGTCGNNCPAGLICYRGQCTAPATPMPVPV